MNHSAMLLVVLSALILIVNSASGAFPHVDSLRSKASLVAQAQAARALVSRIVGQRASEFIIEVNSTLGPKDRDTFMLSQNGDNIQVVGSSGVAVSMGLYYYLKYYCKTQKTWAGEQLHLPSSLPRVKKPVLITRNDRFFYYANVCTMSYTMVFWDWERWQQEIDWMALRGINMPLAFIGQEAIFQRVYLGLGFTQEDLDEHFAGPAFLAWGRMGNIQKWGGPLPQMWITMKLVLQHQILDGMRSLGMIPVLPGFAGHVPSAITRVFPQAKVTRLGLWSRFNSTYSGTYLLDFQDPLFNKIGSAFIEALTYEFGTDHIYNADTFNEMDPASSESAYLSSAGKAVFNAMTTADPKAVWLMQGWLFLNSGFWGQSQVKALVTSVPIGRMLILDLASELDPIYAKFESYYGQPFIWCMIHNFGGTMDLYGSINSVSKGPFAGRKFPNSSMIGIGLTPEGIHQNEIMYEFMSEHAWRAQPWSIVDWVKNFTIQRYGSLNPSVVEGWNLLIKSVYNAPSYIRDNDHVLFTNRPSTKFDKEKAIWYDPNDVLMAWDGFLNASRELEGSELFLYDLVDVGRNCLQDIAMTHYALMIDAFKNKDSKTLTAAGQNLTDLLTDLDTLLKTNDRFLTGSWIAEAKTWGTSSQEKKLYEYNARNQITLWGPNGEIHDYASKQWSGVVGDFYKPRWSFFMNWLNKLIQTGGWFDSYIFNEHILAEVETPWTLSDHVYPAKPSGSAIGVSRMLHAKYRSAGGI